MNHALEIGPRSRGGIPAWILALVLAAITAVLFAPALRYEFLALDDPDYVTANPEVQRGLDYGAARWAFTTGHASNWHPLTWISHQLDVSLWGTGPAGAHATSVSWHAANAAMVFLALAQLTGTRARAWIVAGLFAWHPLRLESVAWVAERKDVLSAFFFLLTLYSYGRYAEAKGLGLERSARPWYVAALLALAGGLMSKPMLVTTPAVLLLLDFWPLRRTAVGWFVLLREKLPFAALSVAACVVTFLAQDAGGAVRNLTAHPVGERLANALVSIACYLRDLVWPAKLAVFYPHPGLWPVATIAGAAVLVLGVSAVAWWRRKVQPALWVGWCWFGGMLVPTLGLVQVGEQARADRYTYLPILGVLIAVVWLVADWAQSSRGRRIVAASFAGIALVAGAVATAAQLGNWRDSVTLFSRALAVTSDNFLAHSALGHHLLEHGNLDAAATELERALAVRPRFGEALNNLGSTRWRQGRRDEALELFRAAAAASPDFMLARSNYGTALLELGRPEEALAQLERAARARPADAELQLHLGNAHLALGELEAATASFERAIALRPSYAHAHNNLGHLALRADRTEDAIEHFERAVAVDPRHANARYNLAEVHRMRGELPQAAEAYEAYLALVPDDADAHLALGLIAQDRGEFGAAAEHLERAVQLRPADARALAVLAWVKATCPENSLRDGRHALALARRANELSSGGDPLVLRSLAAANAELGNFAEAEAIARRAVQLAQDSGAAAMVPWILPQIERYAAGQPWREATPAAP